MCPQNLDCSGSNTRIHYTSSAQIKGRSMTKELELNLAQIEIPETEMAVGYLEYEGAEMLHELRAQNRDTHCVVRQGNRIVTASFKPDLSVLGTPETTVLPSRNLQLCCQLVQHALARHILELGRPVMWLRPLRFTAEKEQYELAPDDLGKYVSCLPSYSISTRVVRPDAIDPYLALCCEIRTASRLLVNCEHLLNQGLSLHGLQVIHYTPQDDIRLEMRPKYLGEVTSQTATSIALNSGPLPAGVDVSTVYIAARKENMPRVLGALLPLRGIGLWNELESKRAQFSQGPNKRELTRKMFAYLGDAGIEILPGLPLHLSGPIGEATHPLFPTRRTTPKPSFLFDPTGTKSDVWAQNGLIKYGPYDAAFFSPSTPNMCVIHQANRKGEVEQFLHKFLHGRFAKGLRNQPYEDGFIRRFRLDDVRLNFFPAQSPKSSDYRKAVLSSIEFAAEHNMKWDLALVQIDDSFRAFQGDENPYLVAKGTYLTHQIPSQEFENQTMAQSEKSLVYSLNNMGLAVYAKLGGVPWLLPSNPAIAHELIVGLGSTY